MENIGRTNSDAQGEISVGVDVGGTFTDLVASDGRTLRIIKIPSTPPDFHLAVIEAVNRFSASAPNGKCHIVHGSTVATNALLQRAGEPIAFVTTDGFRDMLLIGRQNRPKLYALHVERPEPMARSEHCFTVRERINARGEIIEPLTDGEIERLIGEIHAQGLKHVAVCLLFSFINGEHERRIAARGEAGGLSCSLSCDILPEFREYERASTTAINASLRPTVASYLQSLSQGLPREVATLRIMQSGGGTLSSDEAAASAVRLVLSGPAGGVMGAAFVARAAGFENVITYDMGGTSTDVATVLAGQPQWTTLNTVDGLPIGLPMFDINTVGAGGGSVAYVDQGGALRVGPRSAGAQPGPACYARGGTEPTVTDANLVLGRILPERFLGGAMRIDPPLAHAVVETIATRIGRDVITAALGIVRIAEANMEHAIRAVTSRRGLDPRGFALVSFGGAGGLHACALADALDIPRVLVPPYCGVLSALGMVVAPPVVDASRTVVHLGEQLDDDRLAAEFGAVSGETIARIPFEQTAAVEAYADVRFKGQSYEVKVRVDRPSLDAIHHRFLEAYRIQYGAAPAGREIEIVTIRVRRIGRHATPELPILVGDDVSAPPTIQLTDETGQLRSAAVMTRTQILAAGPIAGPLLLVDAEATAYVPPSWRATCQPNGAVVLDKAK